MMITNLRIRGLLIVFSYIAVIVILSTSMLYAEKHIKLLHIACDGEVSVSTERKIEKIQDRFWLGDVQRGFLYKGIFFATDDDKLKATDINKRESSYLVDFKNAIEDGYSVWQIVHVDGNKIYFSARRFDQSKPINKQHILSNLYRMDRSTKKIDKININESNDDVFSVFANKIYYSSSDGEIYEYSDNQNNKLNIRGRFPSISPDGKKLAYAKFGIINDIVYIYDLQTRTNKHVMKSFGPNSFDPIIRWSEDSQFIAIKKASDIAKTPIYVINVLSGDTTYTIEENSSCNWFFID